MSGASAFIATIEARGEAARHMDALKLLLEPSAFMPG